MISEILARLANEPKTNAKLQILKDNLNNELLQRTFVQTLDPTIKYYVKKIPQYSFTGESLTLEQAFDGLEMLSSRKVTGNAAIDHLAGILARLSVSDASIIEKVIAGDLRCGINTASVNKIWKELIPEYPYMRCSSLKASKIKTWNMSKGVYSQTKADGRYNNTNIDSEGNVSLVSRSGIELPNEKFGNIVSTVKQYLNANSQTHGEFLVLRDGKILDREISNGIMTSVAHDGVFAPNEEPVLFVWDQIPLSEAKPGNKYHVPYSERLENLKSQLSQIPSDITCVQLIDTKLVHSVDEVMDHFEEKLQDGLEGTVVKHPDAIWEDTTSKFQVKLKLEVDTIDLMIVGFSQGNGKNSELFGSVQLVSGDELLEVNVSGFTDPMRKKISDNRESYINTIMTVKSNSIMRPKIEGKKYSLFLPRFKEFRDDKTSADTLQDIEDKFESAITKIRQYL